MHLQLNSDSLDSTLGEPQFHLSPSPSPSPLSVDRCLLTVSVSVDFDVVALLDGSRIVLMPANWSELAGAKTSRRRHQSPVTSVAVV